MKWKSAVGDHAAPAQTFASIAGHQERVARCELWPTTSLSLDGALAEPREHVPRVGIRREHRIEAGLNAPSVNK